MDGSGKGGKDVARAAAPDGSGGAVVVGDFQSASIVLGTQAVQKTAGAGVHVDDVFVARVSAARDAHVCGADDLENFSNGRAAAAVPKYD